MMLEKDLTDKVLRAFYRVYNTLGYGFLEKVYERAMWLELRGMGLRCEQQKPIEVFYREQKVGGYFADLVVEDRVIVELKAAEGLVEAHEHQLVNYLKAANIEVGLLLNFGKKPQFKRKVFTHPR